MSDDSPRHIRRYLVAEETRSYCGEDLFGWCFCDPMHAVYSALHGDGIAICGACLDEAIRLLRQAKEGK